MNFFLQTFGGLVSKKLSGKGLDEISAGQGLAKKIEIDLVRFLHGSPAKDQARNFSKKNLAWSDLSRPLQAKSILKILKQLKLFQKNLAMALLRLLQL